MKLYGLYYKGELMFIKGHALIFKDNASAKREASLFALTKPEVRSLTISHESLINVWARKLKTK